jgi:hypothetical protein
MKKFLIMVTIVTIAACNSNNEPKTESMKSGSDSTKMADVTYPYEIYYSSKFEIGDPQQTKMILEIWKDWDNGNLQAHKDHFADSLEMHTYDGTLMKGTRDSVLEMAQNYRNTLASVVSRVYTVAPLKSIDKDENWALVWGMETDTDKKGKVDSFYLQETWRFNKAGKTDLLYQFKADPMPPKK